MTAAYDVTVINQYAYVNHYRGTQVEVLQAIHRELESNPKLSLDGIYFLNGDRAQAHFKISK
jgi:hypothetical protein